MEQFNLLDCTLRDGGYVVDWEFGESSIRAIIQGLVDAGLDYIEVGYLDNRSNGDPHSSVFNSMSRISALLPENRGRSMIVAMLNLGTGQILPEDMTPCNGSPIDGIRIAFHKHQTELLMDICKAVKSQGYRLFIQPTATMGYSRAEYMKLIDKLSNIGVYAISIVDTFGYMFKQDFREYFKILDEVLPHEVAIGFHSHDNMHLSFMTAQDVLEYQTERRLIIDSSLYGIGRGAGNLYTEFIANYYNKAIKEKYDIIKILDLISTYIMPIKETKSWGCSPYFFLTGLYRCHPNFAAFLLEEEEVSVSEFKAFIETIPDEMRTKCRREYVKELFKKHKNTCK
jgi:4-hydroxy 2-oxovalerate aldolase